MREAIHNIIMNSSIGFAWLSNKELSDIIIMQIKNERGLYGEHNFYE